MRALHAALIGGSGRMGAEIQRLSKEDGMVKIVPLEDGAADIVIDFSSPEGLRIALAWCEENRKPLVSGTTGLGDLDFEKLSKASKNIPILWSPNMSYGVAVLARILGNLPRMMGFDITIEETHHKNKKDRPSGTALMFKQKLELSQKQKMSDPKSVRDGDTVGIHLVRVNSKEETLVFEHKAHTRAVFARGALKAAQWLAKQSPGLYSMENVLI